MDLLLPLPVRVTKITTTPISNTALSRSIFTGVSGSLARGGDRFGFDVTVTGASDRESFPMRAALRNIRAGLRGQANRIWLSDPSYKLRGSFPTGELMTNGNFARGATGWATTNSALSVADGYARVQNTAATTGNITNSTAMPIISGSAYVARALPYPGLQTTPLGWAFNGGATLGAGGYFSVIVTAQALFIASFTAAGATFFFSLQNQSTTNGDFVHFLYASASRCALVDGASQVGANLFISSLPANSAGLLLPGDRVQIGTQLNSVVAPLSSDGAGVGYLQCALPWRTSPANNAPVIIDNPMARCILSDSSTGWDDSPGGFADFQFKLEESLDA